MNKQWLVICVLMLLAFCVSCSKSTEEGALLRLQAGSKKKYNTYIVMSDFDCAVCTERLLMTIKSKLKQRQTRGFFYLQGNDKSINYEQINKATNTFIDWQYTSDSTIVFDLAKITNSKKGPYVLEDNNSEVKTYTLGY